MQDTQLERPITLQTRPQAAPERNATAAPRQWDQGAVEALMALPFMDLVQRAHAVHRKHFPGAEIELATLLSVKTGGCAENCGYCPQSAHHDTDVKAGKMMERDEVLEAARAAQSAGATRFCMGAAWRSPNERDLERMTRIVQEVSSLGLETCATLGMLTPDQARALGDAGLDYYNHNLDSAPDFYDEVVSTRVYQDRLDTLAAVRGAGIKVCCGGIVGMGETRRQRAGLVAELASLNPPPESVPVNNLVRVAGTPMDGVDPVDPLEVVRVIAAARITMPGSRVRLSAGRRELGEGIQALCFMAGANSIFYGDKLLVTGNPDAAADRALLARLDLPVHEVAAEPGAGA